MYLRIFIVLGISMRLLRFGLKHPLWSDEAFLTFNLISRDFEQLTHPLDYQQVCPLLFLWAEKAIGQAIGFSEWSLRLLPTIASIASLFLFRHVAGRLLRGLALVIAVAFLAIAFTPIRHAGEIKPYATDFLVALGLIALAVEWLRTPESNGLFMGAGGAGPACDRAFVPGRFRRRERRPRSRVAGLQVTFVTCDRAARRLWSGERRRVRLALAARGGQAERKRRALDERLLGRRLSSSSAVGLVRLARQNSHQPDVCVSGRWKLRSERDYHRIGHRSDRGVCQTRIEAGSRSSSFAVCVWLDCGGTWSLSIRWECPHDAIRRAGHPLDGGTWRGGVAREVAGPTLARAHLPARHEHDLHRRDWDDGVGRGAPVQNLT